MDMRGQSEQHREKVARRVLHRLRQRAALNQAVGILRVWHCCGEQQARDDMHSQHRTTGQDVEALRMIAVVNAAAEGRGDPDAHWD
jgi:hypothetical protein